MQPYSVVHLHPYSQGFSLRYRAVGIVFRRLIALVIRLLVSCTCVAAGIFLLCAQSDSSAWALTVEKTSLRPNQQGGSAVLGGEPTRLTWEARLGQDEKITQIQLNFPQGSRLEGISINDVILEGLTRKDTQLEGFQVSGNLLTLRYPQALPAGTLFRVQLEGVVFPPEGGSYRIGGSYTLDDGSVHELPSSPELTLTSFTRLDKLVAWLDKQAWVQSWNSHQFLDMFLRPQLIVTSLVQLFSGWIKALSLVALGFPLAIPLGLMFSFLKMGKRRIARFIAGLYINVIRGTPLFLQIYIAFFGLPLLGINLNNYLLGTIVLAMNSSAYLAEVFRAGIQSIHTGQFEAAASLGMSPVQSMLYVIIPQAFRRVIPTMTSEFILLYKDTSLLSSVGVLELMMFSKNLTAVSGNITPYVVAAGYYLVVTLPLIRLVGVLERSLDEQEGGGGSQQSSKRVISKELSPSIHESM